jgi:Rad3-related DNA helicase
MYGRPPVPQAGESRIDLTPVLPPPPFLGLPDQFTQWRPGQDHAVEHLLTSEYRFDAMVMPTGSGKSLMYITLALMSGERCLVLTSTNPLTDQLMEDFGDLCVHVRGKSHYRCRKIGHGVTCDRGPCNYGISCSYKDTGCEYFDQVRKAAAAQIVVTNYAFWIYNNKARLDAGQGDGETIGRFGLLVCDEAHDCPDRVADAFTVRLSRRNEVEKYLLQNYLWTDDRRDTLGWAREAHGEADRIYKDAKSASRMERTFQAAQAKRKLKQIIRALTGDGENVVVVPEKKWGVMRVALAWPFDRAEDVMFTGIPHIVFTSATVRGKTMQMLGVDPDQYQLKEYPHIIPQDRRMLYHIPTIRLNFRTKPVEFRTWLTRIDQLIRGREGNGIIHTVSYYRRDEILKRSKYRDRMMSHDTKTAAQVIEAFKGMAGEGKILVSPSVTTGYDFPYDTARWQIIGKIAYPDTSDPIIKERCNRDDTYGPYSAMQTLVQTVGRIVRAEDDRGDSFIIDDNIKWFIRKYADFAPQWFMGSYQALGGVPQS